MRLCATGWLPLALGAAAAGWLLSPEPAWAQDQNQPPAPAVEEDEELGPEAGTKRPAGPDQRSGHWLLHGRFGLVLPFADIAPDLPASSAVSAGPAFGANAGVGLSRHTVLEIAGSYALLSGSARCSTCSGQSLDLGLGLVYHLAQGIAFDPWVSYAAGYRQVTFDGTAQTSRVVRTFSDTRFHGLDFARLALGGDFYPVPQIGVGLFLEVDTGTYISRPSDLGRSVYGYFQAGLRLSLDPVRRADPGVRAAQTRPGRRWSFGQKTSGF